MFRILRVLFGVVILLCAVLMLLLAGWASKFTQHKVDPYEREHLEAAVKFLRAQELATGSVPGPSEFNEWARVMDSKGHYRFDGYGYTLDKRCAPKPSDFCIGFWTGDAFVTYRSWQSSLEEVPLDDSPLLLVSGLLVAGLIAGMVSKALLIPKRFQVCGPESNDG